MIAARVRLETANGVARVTLARPAQRNAIDRAMAEQLFDALETVAGDAEARVLLLAADGADFSAGADLPALEAMSGADAEALRADAEVIGRVYLALHALTKPVVAAVRGRAFAAGAGLASACDIVLAHADAQFAYPEAGVGLVPAMELPMLRRAVGEKRAAELVLTGRVLSALEAERIGLVSVVAPDDSFDRLVDETVARLARAPRTAVALTKWLLYKLDDLSFADGIAAGIVTSVEARQTDEFRTVIRQMVRGADRE